jgi:hypothetical protein
MLKATRRGEPPDKIGTGVPALQSRANQLGRAGGLFGIRHVTRNIVERISI